MIIFDWFFKRIDYQKKSNDNRFFSKNRHHYICVLSSLFLLINGRMRCELGLTSEHCYNTVRNTIILKHTTKPGKRVFRLSDLQTAVQQKLVSTISMVTCPTCLTNILKIFQESDLKICSTLVSGTYAMCIFALLVN